MFSLFRGPKGPETLNNHYFLNVSGPPGRRSTRKSLLFGRFGALRASRRSKNRPVAEGRNSKTNPESDLVIFPYFHYATNQQTSSSMMHYPRAIASLGGPCPPRNRIGTVIPFTGWAGDPKRLPLRNLLSLFLCSLQGPRV